jgi:hypothetical protein
MNMGAIGLVAFLRRFSNITSVSRAFLKRFCRRWSVSLWLPFVQLCTLVGVPVALNDDVASNA